MDPKRELLRHFLASLAYRTQKAVRGAPESFGDFEAGEGVRAPSGLLLHMTSVLRSAARALGASKESPLPLATYSEELARFHETLGDLSSRLESGVDMQGTPERMLQGPLADAMTHAGQLAMLRRLAGHPVAPENFHAADISADNVTASQAQPVRPHADWTETAPDR